MPPKNDDYFIATYEEFFGKGSTPELAFTDLKSNGPSGIDLNEVEFHQSSGIRVEFKLVIVRDVD